MREVRLLASLQDENISRVLAVSATSGRARTSSRSWGASLGEGVKNRVADPHSFHPDPDPDPTF
jgi:hypothetical protein